eukprot:scaffold47808_cov70-Phaeocystis_antarctica.AAC.5
MHRAANVSNSHTHWVSGGIGGQCRWTLAVYRGPRARYATAAVEPPNLASAANQVRARTRANFG